MKIRLSNEKYRYQVYHMIATFYAYNEVSVVNEGEDYFINILPSSLEIKGKGKEFKYEFLDDVEINDNIKCGIYKFFKGETGLELPWGTLMGIRPTKKVLEFMADGMSEEEISSYMKKNYLATDEKIQLCLDVAKKEVQFVNLDKNTVSVYIGMAFCPTKCIYCSFTSNPIGGNKNLVNPYCDTLLKEIDFIASYIRKRNLKIETVYFGGGTPTAVNEEEFETLVNAIYNSFIKDYSIKEFTVECGRPDSISETKLLTMKRYNVSRISINPQTMNNKTLKLIGRGHTAEDVVEKFNLARKLGFKDINMDLIIGLPGEGVEEIDNTVREIKKLNPEGITVHGLSIKRGSILHKLIIDNKDVNEPSIDEVLYAYKTIYNLTKELDMSPYYMYRQKNMVGHMENVGFSKSGFEGIYNIEMIEERQSIIAAGSDAISKIMFNDENRLERFPNFKDLREYINRIDEIITKKEAFLNERWK